MFLVDLHITEWEPFHLFACWDWFERIEVENYWFNLCKELIDYMVKHSKTRPVSKFWLKTSWIWCIKWVYDKNPNLGLVTVSFKLTSNKEKMCGKTLTILIRFQLEAQTFLKWLLLSQTPSVVFYNLCLNINISHNRDRREATKGLKLCPGMETDPAKLKRDPPVRVRPWLVVCP